MSGRRSDGPKLSDTNCIAYAPASLFCEILLLCELVKCYKIVIMSVSYTVLDVCFVGKRHTGFAFDQEKF